MFGKGIVLVPFLNINREDYIMTTKFNYVAINKTDVDGLIEAAVGGMKKAKNLIQVAAVGILMHAEKHGDWTKASVLVKALEDNGAYAASLVAWFVEYGGLVVGGEEGEQGFVGFSGPEHIREHFGEAKVKAWWECKKQASPYKGFDLNVELAKLLERAKKAKEAARKDSAKAEQVKVNDAELEALSALLAQATANVLPA